MTTRVVEIFTPAEFEDRPGTPFYPSLISAGFPSPAEDYIETDLDIQKHLVKNKAATFFLRVQGDSMIEAGIKDGGILVVDRSVTPTSGKIVVAAVDGELTVKRLIKKDNRVFLEPANSKYEPLEITENENLHIWGVVTHAVNNF